MTTLQNIIKECNDDINNIKEDITITPDVILRILQNQKQLADTLIRLIEIQ